jgi:hypothetical protein
MSGSTAAFQTLRPACLWYTHNVPALYETSGQNQPCSKFKHFSSFSVVSQTAAMQHIEYSLPY